MALVCVCAFVMSEWKKYDKAIAIKGAQNAEWIDR